MNNLARATKILNKVISGQDLTATEAKNLFTDIFLYDTHGYHLAAASAAIHTKGETAEELLGFCRSTEEFSQELKPKVPPGQITDLCGTGGGKIKTINVSTLASFIVAAAGYTVGKQAFFGQTSLMGSADILNVFGIDVFSMTPDIVVKTLEEKGICPFYNSAMNPKLKNRSIVAKRVFSENKLGIGSPFHLVALAYSPLPIEKRIYGCYSREYIRILADMFYKLGLKRSAIIFGEGGIPEASNFGCTFVAEQNKDKIEEYILEPKDFGIKKCRVEEIVSEGREQKLEDFLRILYGRETGPKRDLAAINAAMSLYVMGETDDLKTATEIALDILEKKKAQSKFQELVEAIGDIDALHHFV